jgi:hypothetical protein
VLIYKEDAAVENLNEAMLDLQTMASSRDLRQTPLDYIELFQFDEPHGIFNLITLPPKPAQQAEVLAAPPQVPDKKP